MPLGANKAALMGASNTGVLTIDALTSSGTWTCPAGVTSAEILVVAGGGEGGRSNATLTGGGGAGGVVHHTSYAVVASTEYDITVGAGGSGGSYQPRIRQYADRDEWEYDVRGDTPLEPWAEPTIEKEEEMRRRAGIGKKKKP